MSSSTSRERGGGSSIPPVSAAKPSSPPVHEYYATLRTQSALERSEVAIVLIDSSQPVSEQDVRILSMAIDAGRAVVLAFNKWDLVDEDRRRYLDREIDRDLGDGRVGAAGVNVSALTGRHMDKLTAALDDALAGWETRVSTGRLNKFFGDLTAAHPHPVRGGKQPRILFGTQVGVGPPSFALFTTGVPRGRVSALHRAPITGGVRFHWQSAPHHDAGTGKAATLRLDLVAWRPSSLRRSRPGCIAGLRHPLVGSPPR